jgi:hypothetical protein
MSEMPLPKEIIPLLVAEIGRQPYPLLFATISGAHLYGFPSANSDFDLRGVHILPATELLGLDEPVETIEVSKVEQDLEFDLVTHDVAKFMRLLLKPNGYVLEQLLSPLILHTTPEHEELKAIAPECLTRHHAHHYLGFARSQWQLCQSQDPPRIKPLLYTFRVLLTGIHLMQTGRVEANLVRLNEHFKLTYLPDLIRRKVEGVEKEVLPEMDWSFYEGEYGRLTHQLEQASEHSHLPEQPTARPILNNLLLRLRLG